MTALCQRSWEVEAARDGRLTGTARASAEAHLRTCTSCAREADALDGLARGLREMSPAATSDIAIRRLRNRVLAAVDAEQTGRVPAGGRAALGRGHVMALAFAAAFVVVLGGIFGVASWRSTGREARVASTSATEPVATLSPPAAATAQPPPETSIDVSGGEGARFTRTAAADVERFDLVDGTLRLRVRRATGGRRVVVRVPDGEIEDVGTVFEIVVAGGRTERVRVDEGRVTLRLRGVTESTIDAGGTWQRNAPAVATTAPMAAKTAASAKPASATSAKAPAEPASSAEDAAYLEVLRLLREGRETEGRAASRAYLRSFPAGFRRAEMQRVADGG